MATSLICEGSRSLASANTALDLGTPQHSYTARPARWLYWVAGKARAKNAIAERFVRSIKHECLDHIIFLSQKMLERYVREYTEHYNTERPHQGIGNKPIGKWTTGTGKIVCDQRLGGLLKSYRRAA